jgi:enediyne biosynthesis protein E4
VSVRVLVLVLAGAVAGGLLWGARYVLRLTDHVRDDSRAVAHDAPPVPGPFAVPVQPPRRPDQGDPASTQCAIRLQEVTNQTGITFAHRDGSSGRHFTPETMSAGVATFDYDGDGLIDIYFPNGAALPGITYDEPPRHALYKNLGDWRFEDVSERAGLVCSAFGLGIAIGDYDNDGFPDIYLDNFGPNILYHNNGDGTFTDVTSRAGVPGTIKGGRLEQKVGAGACFLDTMGRGQLDLFSGNYVAIELDNYVTPMKGKYPFYPTPLVYTPVPSTLYRNAGDGTFTDASAESGIAASPGRCMGSPTPVRSPGSRPRPVAAWG